MKWRLPLSLILIILLVGPLYQISTSHPPQESSNSPITIEEYIRAMIGQVDENLVFNYHNNLMNIGPRYTGTEGCAQAAYYIHGEFTKMGLWAQFHAWEFMGLKGANVIGTLNGTDPSSDAIIIMSAHYDTTPDSPGADDDGSGVAAVMASAQIMSQYPFVHTIKFIAFSGEEVGTYGSFLYAKQAYEKGDNIVAVINVDMVGYANTEKGGNLIRVFQAPRSAWITEFSQTVSRKYVDSINLLIQGIPNYRGADHQAFLDYGYDAVFFAHYDGYSWGHSANDTQDRLNRTYQVKATKLLLAIVAELAYMPLDLQVILKSPLEGHAYLYGYPVLPIHFGKFYETEARGTTVIWGRCEGRADVKARGSVESVVFCIDDIFITLDRDPPYEWRIQGKHYPPMGKHTLRVYAYDVEGNIASDEMDIRIFTLSYQYAPWE